MLKELSTQIADVVAAAAPSVVQVQGSRRPASGVVYADGIVVTGTRALGREDGLRVRRDDHEAFEAELAGWDPATSLAVLRVRGLNAPAAAPSPDAPRVGHLALALARSWSNRITATAGVISVIGGPLRTSRRRTIEEIIRTDAPMHDGFAGGALLDAAGALVGIATATSIRGLGVVIPAPIAWRTAATVLEHGRVTRGYLGIAGQPVRLAERQQQDTGRETGLLVAAVTRDSPAEAAGLLVGDVVLAFDSQPVESPEDLLDLLARTGAGRAVSLRISRGGTGVDLSVTVGERQPHA